MNRRILLIFHLNFLKNDRGCSAYVYEIAKYLKSKGFSIDFTTNTSISNDFDDFEKFNNKEHLIDNFYPYNSYKCPENYFIGIKFFGLRLFGYKIINGNKKWYICGIYCFQTKYERQKNYYYSNWVDDGFVRHFQQVIKNNHYDFIHIHYIQFADLLKYTNIPKDTKCIYSMQDANYVQKFYGSDLKTFIKGNEIEKELELIDKFDKVMAISNDEKHFFKKFFPDKEFYFLPHPLNKKELPSIEKDINILFLGDANQYNKNAVCWFVEQVYPRLKNKEKIWIVGRVWELLEHYHPKIVKKMNQYGIKKLSFAENLDDLYARTKVSIVPMFGGTGMKIKTIDSMSRGIPVVATELGVDGFPDKNNNGCLVAPDNGEIFAQYIDKLLSDKEFYKKTVEETKEYFDKYLSLDANKNLIDKAFGNV